MLPSGDYISPTFNYQPRLNKPVLSYWIVAVLQVFDVSSVCSGCRLALGALTILLRRCSCVGGGQPGKPASGATAWRRAAAGHCSSPHLHRHLHLDLHELTLLLLRAGGALSERRRLFCC